MAEGVEEEVVVVEVAVEDLGEEVVEADEALAAEGVEDLEVVVEAEAVGEEVSAEIEEAAVDLAVEVEAEAEENGEHLLVKTKKFNT